MYIADVLFRLHNRVKGWPVNRLTISVQWKLSVATTIGHPKLQVPCNQPLQILQRCLNYMCVWKDTINAYIIYRKALFWILCLTYKLHNIESVDLKLCLVKLYTFSTWQSNVKIDFEIEQKTTTLFPILLGSSLSLTDGGWFVPFRYFVCRCEITIIFVFSPQTNRNDDKTTRNNERNKALISAAEYFAPLLIVF